MIDASTPLHIVSHLARGAIKATPWGDPYKPDEPTVYAATIGDKFINTGDPGARTGYTTAEAARSVARKVQQAAVAEMDRRRDAYRRQEDEDAGLAHIRS